MIEFEKYKSRTEQPAIIANNHPDKEDSEAGFTAADYDDHSSAPGRSEPWMSSTPVILLIEYLRKYPDQGVILYEQRGTVGLKFKPGINGADIKNGRSQIAMNVFGLLEDAADDLKAMIIDGIEIPLLTRTTVPSMAAGPP